MQLFKRTGFEITWILFGFLGACRHDYAFWFKSSVALSFFTFETWNRCPDETIYDRIGIFRLNSRMIVSDLSLAIWRFAQEMKWGRDWDTIWKSERDWSWGKGLSGQSDFWSKDLDTSARRVIFEMPLRESKSRQCAPPVGLANGACHPGQSWGAKASPAIRY